MQVTCTQKLGDKKRKVTKSLRASDFNGIPLPDSTLLQYWFPGFAVAHGVTRVAFDGSTRTARSLRDHQGPHWDAARYSIVFEFRLGDEAAVSLAMDFGLTREAALQRVAEGHRAMAVEAAAPGARV